MKKHRIYSLLVAGSMLAGCTMIPDYMRPDLPVSADWPDSGDTKVEVPTEAEQTVPDIGWKQFFRSPGVQKAVAMALANNRDLKVASANIIAAQALYRIQRADLVPGVEANLTGDKQHLPRKVSQAGHADMTATYNANLGMTAFELDAFGRVRSLTEAALEQYLATQQARDALQVSLIGETANAYLQWLADRKALVLTQETLKAQQGSYDLTKHRFDAGISSKIDVAQASVAFETAKSNLALYERYVMQDRNALVLLMGVADDKADLPENETLDDVQLMADLPVELPSQVLLLRPDVSEAEHHLKSYNADIGAARAAFFPTISLTGSFGFASRGLSSLFSSGTGGAWLFAPQIALPIFEGGANVAQLGYSKAQKEAAVATYEQSIQSAFREVADALAARQTLDDQMKAQLLLEQSSSNVYDLSNARYKAGIDSYLDVLDAQRTLYSAQLTTVDVQRQTQANLVNLYKSLGGGVIADGASVEE